MRLRTIRALHRMRASLARWRANLGEAFEDWSHGRGEAAGDPPDEVARVRLTAELAADRLFTGQIAWVTNPWRRGTRFYVLWETSYQARLLQNDFAETSPCEPWPPLPAGLAALMV